MKPTSTTPSTTTTTSTTNVKKRLALVALLLLFVPIGCDDEKTSSSSSQGVEAIRNIEVAEAALLLSTDDTVVVLDIRTPAEFAQGHIDGAVNVDFMGDSFDSGIAALDKDTTYLMHCRSGGRSGKSLAKFQEHGFTSILHLDSGIAGWEAAGQPLTKKRISLVSTDADRMT